MKVPRRRSRSRRAKPRIVLHEGEGYSQFVIPGNGRLSNDEEERGRLLQQKLDRSDDAWIRSFGRQMGWSVDG